MPFLDEQLKIDLTDSISTDMIPFLINGQDIVKHTKSADRHLYHDKIDIIYGKHLGIRQFASMTGKHRLIALSMIVKHPDLTSTKEIAKYHQDYKSFHELLSGHC